MARSDHAMTYDTGRGVGVLFGGFGTTCLDDTWEWESRTMTWIERQPVHRPPAGWGHAMVYDAARAVTVLFGGTGSGTTFSDTWLWDGTDWMQACPATSPSARYVHAMVYEAQRQVTVLFGGLGDGLEDDTWEWDGEDWTEQVISGPSPRCCVGMAYDPRRDATVLFGGNNAFGALRETWERSGSGDWQKVTPPGAGPTPRERPGMVYFPPLRRVVLFGGEDFTYYDDTWFWNGQRWRSGPLDPRPSGRCCMGMVYDSVLRGVLLFGGSVSFVYANDTWLFR